MSTYKLLVRTACALLTQVFCILQGGLNIPGISRESAERHRMAASHSPQLGNGLLAESLQTSIAMFGESPAFSTLLKSMRNCAPKLGLMPQVREMRHSRPCLWWTRHRHGLLCVISLAWRHIKFCFGVHVFS